MCYVIITSRTLLWTLLTIGSALIMLAAVVTPQWLVGAPRLATTTTKALDSSSSMPADHHHRHHHEQGDHVTTDQIGNHDVGTSRQGKQSSSTTTTATTANNSSLDVKGNKRIFTPTLGIFNRCTRIHHLHDTFEYTCAPFVSSFSMPSDEFPGFWKASLIFFSIGLTLMAFTVGTSIIGCCIRAIVRKSIFTISGTIQSIAGLFYILGLVLYPAGWHSKRVTLLCGEEASYFLIGECSLGWAFFLAMGGTLLTIFCSVLSVWAETSTSSEKVQDEIYEGKNLICLL